MEFQIYRKLSTPLQPYTSLFLFSDYICGSQVTLNSIHFFIYVVCVAQHLRGGAWSDRIQVNRIHRDSECTWGGTTFPFNSLLDRDELDNLS